MNKSFIAAYKAANQSRLKKKSRVYHPQYGGTTRDFDILGKCWDTISGCTKISPGCKNCYMVTQVAWLNRMNQTDKYKEGPYVVKQHEKDLDIPLKRKEPFTYFVNSMSDTFHDDVEDDFIVKIFEVMKSCPQHTFQVLTKRPERMLDMVNKGIITFSPNVWAGVTVERGDYTYRIDLLRQIPARVRYIMFEPLLGQIGEVDFSDIDWAIVGGESQKDWRPMDIDWVREIRDTCSEQNVIFTFKQYAAKNPKPLGRILDGVFWDGRPQYEEERNQRSDDAA